MKTLAIGLVTSLLSSQATGIGALPILLGKSIQKFQWTLVAFGGGVMLAATAFSLIVPGITVAVNQGYAQTVAALIMVTGNLLGWWVLWFIQSHFPYEQFFNAKEASISPKFKKIWLFILAITLHNFPEGLVVGVGLSSSDPTNYIPLATGIGLQNIPEGLVVALSLITLNYSAVYAVGVSFLTGFVEPIGTVLGVLVISWVQPLLPWGMAFAAGAMLFVLINEIFPEIYRENVGQEGALGIMMGFMVMTFFDVAFF